MQNNGLVVLEADKALAPPVRVNFQLWMRCLNCGCLNLSWHEKGTPIIWEHIKHLCQKCGCNVGWERVDE